MYTKEFDHWSVLKKQLNIVSTKPFFHEREVWWCSIGINIGVEIDGKHENFERPVIVLKKFNNHLLWILPLTSQPKFGTWFYSLQYHQKTSYVLLTQMRSISNKRLLRKIRTLPHNEFTMIWQALIALVYKTALAGNESLGGRSQKYY